LRAVEAIERNARAQTRVVDDLLDVSRMIQGRFALSVAPCDLCEVVRSVLEAPEPALSAKGLVLDVSLEPGTVMVTGDRDRLKQVVVNLLSNAVKFTPRGGRISVSVARQDGRGILRVADTGEGIAPAFIPHVFDPFRQGALRTMRVGLGLGLAIVHEIVALHGGSVVAESAGDGQGAAFTVTLPLEHLGVPLPQRAAGPFAAHR
jgi:signal transduction histidine kinase